MLSFNEIEFVKLNRATVDGDSPSVTFQIKDIDAVSAFVKGLESTACIWGDYNAIHTLRLNYRLINEEDQRFLIVARSVGSRTMPYTANMTLAHSILTVIYDASDAEKADIWIGLTLTELDKCPSEKSALIKQQEEALQVASEESVHLTVSPR